MPKKTKLRRHSVRSWTADHYRILQRGNDYFGAFAGPDGERDAELMQAAWRELGEDITAAWIAERPGSRPYGWWQCAMPEGTRRERIDGRIHPHDRAGCVHKDLHWGRPRRILAIDLKAEYESEVDYLKRLNLLTPREVVLAKQGMI